MGWPPIWWTVSPRLALAMCVALLVACTASPPTPVPTPALSAPPAESSPGSQTPSLPPTQPPSPPAGEWLPLTQGDEVGAAWSADASHLLVHVSVTNGPTEAQQVHLLRADGELVATYTGADDGFFVDASTFVLLSWQRRPTGSGPDDPWTIEYGPLGGPAQTAYLGQLGSDELVEIDLPSGQPLPNGKGAVAFDVCLADVEIGSTCDEWGSVVWENGELAPPVAGYPSNWSADGEQLAVLHPDPDERTIGIDGWLEVLAWPGLSPVASDPDNPTGPLVHFDPAGEYVAYMSHGQVKLLDMAAGIVRDIGPPTATEFFAWDGQQRVVIADEADGTIAAYGIDGAMLEQWDAIGDRIVGSGNGSTLLAYWVDRPGERNSTLAVIRRGLVESTSLPGRVVPDGVSIAPDGSAMALVMHVDQGQVIFLARPASLAYLTASGKVHSLRLVGSEGATER